MQALNSPSSSSALYYIAPKTAKIRTHSLPALLPHEARVRAEFSALSRGTERLVAAGLVPKEEYERMRCPLQEGDFPFPVKYGYCSVGIVEAVGSEEEAAQAWLGRRVFVLHPHQDHYNVATSWLNLVPDEVPPMRASLAANMETALNAIWDSGVSAADRVVVVGGGIVGLLITYLAAKMPGTQTTLVDVNPERAKIAAMLGANFAFPQQITHGTADVTFHTSAKAVGLDTAIRATCKEGRVVELSWYGDQPVSIALGGAFHAGRISLISSQVGTISPAHAARGWVYSSRLQAALGLLRDEGLDQLIDEVIDFANLPAAIPDLLADGYKGLVTLIRYP